MVDNTTVTRRKNQPVKPPCRVNTRSHQKQTAQPSTSKAPTAPPPEEAAVRVIGEIQVIPQPEFRYERKYQFHCVIKGCTYVAKKVKEWNDHHRNKHGHKKYRCNKCAKICSTITSMKRHTYTHGLKKHRCNNCNELFMFASELRVHRRKHQASRNFVCTRAHCRKSYKQRADLLIHIEAVHAPRKYKCTYKDCKTKCRTKKYLQDHMKSHTTVVKCKKCPKTFKHRRSMYRHLASHN